MAIGFPVKADYATGDVLSAANMNDLSGTLNTIQSVEYAAGKNKIINGNFFVNQRAFSSTTTDGAYGFDRFKLVAGSGATMSAQTFTTGTAPVSGYEARNFCRIVTTGQSGTTVYSMLEQDIEDVRTFAGQTITLSFWAKAASGTPKIATQIFQQFGAGGSPSATVETYVGQSTLSTSWARYSVSIAVPSISGKTIGTTANSSYLGIRFWVSAGTDNNAQTGSLGIQSNTFDIWGVQVEASSTASDFQTATGTLQGELAACQRYYFRSTANAQYNPFGGFAYSESTSQCLTMFSLPVTMRAKPASVDYFSPRFYDAASGNAYSGGTVSLADATQNIAMTRYAHTSSPFTTGRMMITNTDSASGYYGFSAEL